MCCAVCTLKVVPIAAKRVLILSQEAPGTKDVPAAMQLCPQAPEAPPKIKLLGINAGTQPLVRGFFSWGRRNNRTLSSNTHTLVIKMFFLTSLPVGIHGRRGDKILRSIKFNVMDSGLPFLGSGGTTTGRTGTFHAWWHGK